MSVVNRPTARTLERSLGVALVGVPAVVLVKRHRRAGVQERARDHAASTREPRPLPPRRDHIPVGLGLD